MAGKSSFKLSGWIADVVQGRIFRGRIVVEDGRIASVSEDATAEGDSVFTPGLVDAHVHVESSLLSPAEFGRAACVHGSVASVSDPHEIANVLGLAGVEWMIADAARTPFRIYFGAPSCVPATPFETAGAKLGPEEIDQLLAREDILYLSEVMNFPAVIGGDARMESILQCAWKRGKHIDGHAPGVVGDALSRYAAAGIETDHECTTLEEGRQRCRLGMKVAIREGSAARNFEALWPLLNEFPAQAFFCSDDKHPDDLMVSHINALAARAVARGVDRMTALRVATQNPVQHYGLGVGLLQAGDPADIAEWDNLRDWNCRNCWIGGELVATEGKPLLPRCETLPINQFVRYELSLSDLALPEVADGRRQVIRVLDGQLLTGRREVEAMDMDVSQDLLKLVVVNRYHKAPVAVALIEGFGLKKGALASSVAHDSHNIVAVGTNDTDLLRAVHLIMEGTGGLSAVCGNDETFLPLPIAGLMSLEDAWIAGVAFQKLTDKARQWECPLGSPFMSLSFMALLVIPSLKLSDKGLFDVDRFELV